MISSSKSAKPNSVLDPPPLFGSADKSNGSLDARSLVFLLFLAALPFLGAKFGYGNQSEQIPVVARLVDPAALPGDLFVDSAATLGQPRYYYSLVLAWLTVAFPLPLVVHGLHLLSNLGLGLVTFVSARRLLGTGALGGAIAASLAVTNPCFSLGLAGYLRFDSFQPANVAIPLALYAVLLLIDGRQWAALAAAIAASAVHPTIGTEVFLFGVGGVLAASLLARGGLSAVVPTLTCAGLFLVGTWLLWGLPKLGLSAAGPRMSGDELFSVIARFRAPHHYLGLSFPRESWAKASVFVLATGAVAGLHALRVGWTHQRRVLAVMSLATIALCILSLWFVDIAHDRMWVTAQVFRMLLIVKWVGFLYLGWLGQVWVSKTGLMGLLLVASILVPNSDAHPYAIATAVGAWLVLDRLTLPGVASWAIAGSAALLAIYFERRYGLEVGRVRGTLALLLLVAVYLLPRVPRLGLALGGAMVASVLVSSYAFRERGILGRPYLAGQFTWSDLSNDADEIARAAGKVSPPNAVWVVPPNFETFRVLANRTIVVNFTAVPFEDGAMLEWRDRLRTLYGETNEHGFGALRVMTDAYRRGVDLQVASQKYGATYAVLYAETPWLGPVLAANKQFKAVRIAP